jgi:Mycothiol maleylpyruvate isomerase N-terminal domain
MSEGHEVAYRELRSRVREVVEQVDASALDRVAPATPKWRAHDVLAHLVGVPEDVVNGRMEGLASDAWTQAQVDRRTAASVDQMLAEWDACAPPFEALLADGPAEITGQAIFDAGTHEHDLFNALGITGDRDSDAIGVGWEWIVDARTRGNAPAICFVTESGEQISGTGDVVARVEATRFEFFRAVAGRRTAAEIASYGWDREPDPVLLIAADFFSIPSQSIGE